MRLAIRFCLFLALVLASRMVPAAEPEASGVEAEVFQSDIAPTPANGIDELVFAKLESMGVRPVLCSDAVFIRRAYLDVIGALPTAADVREFLKDTDEDKRRRLIDRLLADDRFADYWAMRWGDVLRIKAEFPVNLWPNAAQAYHRWVRASLAADKPYDRFVRELLTSSGSNFRVGQVNFYRAVQNRTPEGIAAAAALTFLGSRIESWPKDRAAGLAVFFAQIGYKPTSEWKEEIVFWDPLHASLMPGNAVPGQATLPVPGYVEPKPAPKPIAKPPAAKPAAAKPAAAKPAAAKPAVKTAPGKSEAKPQATSTPATKVQATSTPATKVQATSTPATGKPAAGKAAAKESPAPVSTLVATPMPKIPATPRDAVFPDGTLIRLPQDRDPREVFADWLIRPDNPWFARAAVNRVWAWLLGRGIVHEPDDIRGDNPPSNPELLALLEKEFVESGYDLKRLYRLILTSNTYQLSSMPRFTSPEAAANFASYPLRRLDAEVLIDAVNKLAGTTDLYTSPIPEPFTYIPQDKAAVAIADGSITSPFLALFGRSARATGMENERDNKPAPAQWLHTLNSSHFQRKLEQGPGLKAIFDSGRPPQEIVEELYLTILSRRPTAEEVRVAMEYGRTVAPAKPQATGKPAAKAQAAGKPQAGKAAGKPQAVGKPAANKPAASKGKPAAPVKRRDDWVDIAWALINSSEFLYRH